MSSGVKEHELDATYREQIEVKLCTVNFSHRSGTGSTDT